MLTHIESITIIERNEINRTVSIQIAQEHRQVIYCDSHQKSVESNFHESEAMNTQALGNNSASATVVVDHDVGVFRARSDGGVHVTAKSIT